MTTTMARIELPFSAYGVNLYTIAPDYYELSRSGKHFIRIQRDPADNGIILAKYGDNGYYPVMHSRTPFDKIRESPELLTKIIKAAIQ